MVLCAGLPCNCRTRKRNIMIKTTITDIPKTRNRIKHDNVKSSKLIKKIIEMSGCKNAKEASENCYFRHHSINEWLRGQVSPQVSSVFLFSKELKVNLVDALTMVEIEMRCEKD